MSFSAYVFPTGSFFVGDCFDVMEGIDVGPDKFDMLLADLPYGTTHCRWDALLPFDQLWPMYLRVCKLNAAMLFTAQTPFDKVLGASNLPLLRYEWIWEKALATGHLNAKRAPMKAHENVLVFYRKAPTYNPEKTSGHPRKRSTAAQQAGSAKDSHYGRAVNDQGYDSTERYPRSVLRFAADPRKQAIHDSQKPVALFEYLIRTYTNPGETVFDNVAGSGTTAIAAIRSGRRWTCIEKDVEQAEKTLVRIETEYIEQGFYEREPTHAG